MAKTDNDPLLRRLDLGTKVAITAALSLLVQLIVGSWAREGTWGFFINIVWFPWLVLGVAGQVYGVWLLATGSRVSRIYTSFVVACAAVPVLGLLASHSLQGRATRTLKENGYTDEGWALFLKAPTSSSRDTNA